MTDILSPEMEAMLKISGAMKLAKEPDVKPRKGRKRSTVPAAPTAPDSPEILPQVQDYLETVSASLSASDEESEPEPFEDAFSVHEVMGEPLQPVKRGRGRPRKNPIIVRQPAGVLRKQQIHDIMKGDWEIVDKLEHDKRDIRTACNYLAKRVYVLRDKRTGRTIHAASGEINAHTSLIIPKDDKEARKIEVSSAFA